MPVTVRLVDAWNQPIAGAEVWLEMPQFAPRQQWTNGIGEVEFDVVAGGHYRVTVRSTTFVADSRQLLRGARTTVFCMLRPEYCGSEGMTFPAFEDLSEPLKEVLGRSRAFGEELRRQREEASMREAGTPVAAALPEHVMPSVSGLEEQPLQSANVAPDVHAQMVYRQLDATQRATLLNLFVKMYAATLFSTYSVWQYVREVARIDVDRVHVHVWPELLATTKWAVGRPCWREVCGVLHDPLDENYELRISAKTEERKGNLQLTLFRHRNGRCTQVDADIDLEGLWHTHFREVVRNWRTGKRTQPGIVYQVLRWYQNLEPHRGFEVGHFVAKRGPWRAMAPMRGVCTAGGWRYGWQ